MEFKFSSVGKSPNNGLTRVFFEAVVQSGFDVGTIQGWGFNDFASDEEAHQARVSWEARARQSWETFLRTCSIDMLRMLPKIP